MRDEEPGSISDLENAILRSTTISVRRSKDRSDHLFELFALAVVTLALVVLLALVTDIVIDGLPRLNWEFVTGNPSRFAGKAGILPALVGSLYLMILTALISLPLGVASAVYLEEYAPKSLFTRLIELNIANLAAVPSIIYGLLGLQVFVRYLALERSLIAGALTMSLLILPVIIIASREAIRAVPLALRDASRALGARKYQVVWHTVLPLAFPGILTGGILGLSRAIGETAPLITLGALTYVAFLPDGLFSAFTVLPIQTFNWISRPQEAFHTNAAAAMIILLAMLLTLNGGAIYLRGRLQRKISL